MMSRNTDLSVVEETANPQNMEVMLTLLEIYSQGVCE